MCYCLVEGTGTFPVLCNLWKKLRTIKKLILVLSMYLYRRKTIQGLIQNSMESQGCSDLDPSQIFSKQRASFTILLLYLMPTVSEASSSSIKKVIQFLYLLWIIPSKVDGMKKMQCITQKVVSLHRSMRATQQHTLSPLPAFRVQYTPLESTKAVL